MKQNLSHFQRVHIPFQVNRVIRMFLQAFLFSLISSSISLTFQKFSKSFSVNFHFCFKNADFSIASSKVFEHYFTFFKFYLHHMTKWQILHTHLIPSLIIMTFCKLLKSFSVNCYIFFIFFIFIRVFL